MLSATAHASDYRYYQEEFRIPTFGGARGLEAVIVRPGEPGRYPLVLISHGSARTPDERRQITPLRFLPQAREFARRGWAAVAVLRKGYGDSDDTPNYHESCDRPNHLAVARVAAHEMRATIAYLAARQDIDRSKVLAVGHSVGGLFSLALAADPPPGLVGVINFAGGRGGRGGGEFCGQDQLVEAMRTFGRDTHVPTLWVYVDNDRLFPSSIARRWHTAFVGAGGKADFVRVPSFGSDGHDFFGSVLSNDLWTKYVDEFLARHSLQQRRTLLPSSVPSVPAPRELTAGGQRLFLAYRTAAPHKALAISTNGKFSWESGRRTIGEAKAAALARCAKMAPACRIAVVDDELAR